MEQNYFEKLAQVTLTKEQVEVRPADAQRDGFTLVLYKTRNTDKNILDRIVGPQNWQKGHNGNPCSCYIEIWDSEKKQWIHKDNFGESSDRSAKGSATDAMKRAGEDWGIGRELYTCPRIFIPASTVEVNYGTGYDLPEDVRKIYAKENVIVKEFAVTNQDGEKAIEKLVLCFADDTEFFRWEKSFPQPLPCVQAAQAASCKEEAAEKAKMPKKEKPVKKQSEPSAPASPAEDAPESCPAPFGDAARKGLQEPQEPQAKLQEPDLSKQENAAKPSRPQDVIFTLLDGYDPKKEGLRVYEGKTMQQLLEEFPTVINVIANPTFRWESKMTRDVWEAAKETVQNARMN